MSYKSSNYNYFIVYNNIVICYNAISGAMLTISQEQFNIYNELKNDLKLLKRHKKEIFDVFVKYRFIISNEIDEISILKFRNRKEIFLNNVYKLTINPTMDCNFKCWYCYEKHIKSKMSNKVITNIIKHINFLTLNHRISGLNLSWFGGEPLLYFEEIVYPLSVELKKIMMKNNILAFTNSITTNGYLINKNIIEKLGKINLWQFQITLDGNENNHNRNRNVNGKPTFMKIVENINLLCQFLPDLKLTLRINYDNKSLYNIEELLNFIPIDNRDKITIDFQRIWQVNAKNNSIDDVLKNKKEIFESNGFTIINSYLSDINKGYKCYADKWFQAVINYNGNVYKCTARDFNANNRCGHLQDDGVIKWYPEKIINRFSRASFENQMCLKCKILPLCMGSCSQRMIENQHHSSDELCLLKSAKFSIEDYVVKKYEKILKSK